MKEWRVLAWLSGVFLFVHSAPFDHPQVARTIREAFLLPQWHTVDQALACVVPAMLSAGAISTLLSQASLSEIVQTTQWSVTLAPVVDGPLRTCGEVLSPEVNQKLIK